MPNSLDSTGLQLATRTELVAQFTADMQAIYGADINLGSDTPDGQMMNIFIQSVLDVQDLLSQIYNSFDPDLAIGNILDQRVSINGIQRQAGTFTLTNITIVTSQACNLYGLDQSAQPVFTVADNAGNQFQLQQTQNISGPGTYVFSFQASVPGAILTVPNTITVPVTIVLGVTSINNPTAASSVGLNEESDAQLRIRRQKSVSLASQGFLAGLLAALENINGITSAFVYENNTGSTDGDGVPGHSIWVIVSGTAAAADIANAIYQKRNAGCGMFGSQTFTITQLDGGAFVVAWDNVASQNLFISFTAGSIDGINPPDIASIRSQLVNKFVPGVFQEVDINHLATIVQQIDPNCLVTNAGFTVGQTQILLLNHVPASGSFQFAYNGNTSASVAWNDSIGTIQSKLQAVPGLSAALVTGSLATQTLNINLSALNSVPALITVVNNTLMDSVPNPITISEVENYANTITPTSKKNQFSFSAADIIIIPMILSPTSSIVVALGTKQFTGLGGYGTLTYSITVNNSGGSINATTGLYTAGSTPGTDTLQVQDAMGNTANASVQVV